MLGLLGLVGGFFSGAFTFAMISALTGGKLNAEWVYWFLSITSALAGLVISFYFGVPLIQVSTALVGSYLFMRSWTLFFPGNYPSETELIKNPEGAALDIGGIFWLYVAIFAVTFIASLIYQCKQGEDGMNEEVIDGLSRIHSSKEGGSMMSSKSDNSESKMEEEQDAKEIDSY